MTPAMKRDTRLAALRFAWAFDAKDNPAWRARLQAEINELTRMKV